MHWINGRMTQAWDGEVFLYGSEVMLTQRLFLCAIGVTFAISGILGIISSYNAPSGPNGFTLLSVVLFLGAVGLCVQTLSLRSLFIRVSRDRIEVESPHLLSAFAGAYGPQDVLWLEMRQFEGRRSRGARVFNPTPTFNYWILIIATADGRKHCSLAFMDHREAFEVERAIRRAFFGPQGGFFPQITNEEHFLELFR